MSKTTKTNGICNSAAEPDTKISGDLEAELLHSDWH
jgi:hypothetical protein